MKSRSRPAELLTAVAGAIVGLMMAFGMNVTDDQAAAILVAVSLVPAVVTAYVEITK